MKPTLILFVHGLGATSQSTWGAFERLIAEDARLGAVADVAFFGFKTAKLRWLPFLSGRMQKVADLSEGLRTEIEERYREYASIVLVGHSMGGLIVRQYLVDEVRSGAPLRVNNVLLYAVPNQGSEVAAVAQLFSVVHAQLGDLSPDSMLLETLNRDWRAFNVDAHVSITYVVAGLDEAVRKQSAVGFWGDGKVRFVKDKAHSELVAVADTGDLAFVILRNAVLASGQRGGAAVPEKAAPSPGPHLRAPTDVALKIESTPQTGPPPTSVASQLPPRIDQSRAQLNEVAEARPRLDELFEIVTDPDEVARALFQTERSPGLAPYDVEYVNAREGVPDIQQALETALRASKGRLLVCGLRGIGKTREVGELARAACATKWKVLVARGEGNARMGPALVPRELADARLLLVVDNLHNRVLDDADPPSAPYVERLERLLTALERQLPGDVRVLATARDEPRFQPDLQLPRDSGPWHGFGVFRLPKFTDDGLRHILTTLAARAGVPLEAGDVPKFVENSDHKPETIFINVDLARRKRAALTHALWKPTEGESWQLRFDGARALQSGVDRVCHALQVVVKAGVPARVPYVTSLALAGGEPHPDAAVDMLVGEGLLRQRLGVLTPFSPEQLDEMIGQGDPPASTLEESARLVELAIIDPQRRHKDWIDDLLALALGLKNEGKERAEAIVTRAIDLDPTAARAYRIRAGIRFGRADYAGAEADLHHALEVGDKDADTYFLRACIRNLRADHAGALDDLDLAMKHGRDDGAVHAQRGTALYQLQRWPEADAAMTTAIERGEVGGGMYFTRGIIRLQQNDAAGADRDLSAALAAGTDLNEVAHQIRELERGPGLIAPAQVPAAGGPGGNALTYALRGWMRLRLGRNREAEDDLTAAIDNGAADGLRTLAEAAQASSLPLVARARQQLNALKTPFGDGLFFHLRGLARLNLEEFAGAVADFDQAIARGFADGEVFFGRGSTYLRLDRAAEADEDATRALAAGKTDAPTYALRATARLALKRFAEGEQDFDQAIALDADNAQLYAWRGVARMQQRKLTEADSDLTTAIARRADARTLFQRGCVRFDLGMYGEAEADLTAAIDLRFDPAVAFVLRGMARLLLNKLKEAGEDADAAFTRGAADVQAYSLRAAVRLTEERNEEADADLTAAIGLERNDEWVFSSRGRARYALERYGEAEQDYTAAIALGASDADVFVQRGRSRLAQNKGADAEADITKAMADRHDAFVHFCLARARQQQEQYEGAEAEFDLALHAEDRHAFRTARGNLRLIRGNVRGAEQDLDIVIAAEPANTLALYLRGWARYARGGFADALADRHAALAQVPNDATLFAARVLVNIRLDDLAAAADDCQRLDAIDPEGADALGGNGALLLARGQFDAAVRSLKAAAERDTVWTAWHGLACLLAGQLEEATQAYQQVAAANLPFENLKAINELEFHLQRHPDRAAAGDVRSAAALIRSALGQRAG